MSVLFLSDDESHFKVIIMYISWYIIMNNDIKIDPL